MRNFNYFCRIFAQINRNTCVTWMRNSNMSLEPQLYVSVSNTYKSIYPLAQISDSLLGSPDLRKTSNSPWSWRCVTTSCLPAAFWATHISSVITSSSLIANRISLSSIWQPSDSLVTLRTRTQTWPILLTSHNLGKSHDETNCDRKYYSWSKSQNRS